MFEPYGPTGLAVHPDPRPDPAHIGRYMVTGELGRSPFVTLYRAVHEQHGTPVAIKLLAPEATADPTLWHRFVVEGQQLRTVASPALVALHESDELDNGQPYLVLDLADRGDLRTRVEQHKLLRRPITADDALQVAEALTVALAPLHAAHLVHRNITPTSLLICSGAPPRPDDGLLFADEELKLADLGLDRDLAELAGTSRGGPVGHVPAEQRDPFGIVDPRVDVYGASALLYWLVTGTHPGPSPERNRAGLARSPFPAVFQAALMAGLSDDPAHRQDGIEDWYDELAGLTQPRRPVPPPPPAAPHIDLTDDPLPGRASRLATAPAPRRLVLAGVTGALLVGSAVLAVAVPLVLKHRGGTVGTEASPVIPVTVQAGAGASGTTVATTPGPEPTGSSVPSPSLSIGQPAVLPGGAGATAPTGSTLPLASPAPAVTPAGAAPSSTAATRRSATPSAVARTPATTRRSTTATTAAANQPATTPAPTTASSQPVATLTAGTDLVSTACGTLAVAPSATAGWRDVQWVPSSAYTARAVAYLGEPDWPETAGAASLHAPNGSFSVTVHCHDGSGTAVSATVSVA